jgi:signal transduction histidine kinase
MIDEAVDSCGGAAAVESTLLHKVMAPHPSVRCDRDRIVQCLGNLVGNALEFCPQGEIEIGFEPADGEVVFFVRDNGPGLSPAEYEHVFERHFRGRRFGTTGLGLGLAIAKGIVEGHSGRIWVDSKPGHGATFRFALPAS